MAPSEIIAICDIAETATEADVRAAFTTLMADKLWWLKRSTSDYGLDDMRAELRRAVEGPQ